MVQAGKSRFFKSQEIALACLTSLLLAAGLLFADGNTFRLTGRVVIEDGQTPPSGTVVRLETARGALVAQRPVDTDGGFEFDFLAKGNYMLTASAEGFQPARKQIDQRFWVNQVFVRLTLMRSQFRIRHSKPGNILDVRSVIPKSARKEYEKGKKAYDAGDLPGAEKYFENAVKEHPCYPEAQVQLSIVAGMRHENSKTEAALRKIVNCAPDFIPAYFRLGFLLNAEKRFEESVKVLRSGLNHSSEAWQLHHELAVALAGQGKYAEAEQEYQKVLSLNQQPPAQVHAELANVYLRRDKYADAYHEMEAYIGASPKGPLAPAVRKSMREMKAAGVLGNAPQ
jgi:tetratricopeptide (TPR) repeat protein